MDFSFTFEYPGRMKVILTEVRIFPSFDPRITKLDPKKDGKKYVAIWDTGATNTVITQKVINDLKLPPIGALQCKTVAGKIFVNKHLINVHLPNNIMIPMLEVTSGEIGDSADVLIGMDIISLGDLAITNKNRITVFSFRIPSRETIDFIKNPHKETPIISSHKPGRNDKCPCGSGKKYKMCCERKNI